ncbi:MAG: YeeE/YedE family protein [Spirochaetes bacterium]|jgi:uncharacterized membrane protein YedE/YeeE|nr:YeeE/YedE family protein [Spirochaetota bacterium]
MSILTLVTVGLLMGLVFGVALEKSRVFEPGMIVGQMQLRNFTMLKVFLSASVFGLLILAVMNGVFGIPLGPKGTNVAANIIGGLLLGAGFVMAGACPGTSLAQVGAGYKDAWFVLAGGVLGSLVYGYIKAPVADGILAVGSYGKLRLDQLAGMPFWALALIVAVLLTVALAWLEKRFPWRQQLGEDFEGALAGSTESSTGTERSRASA